MDKIVILGIETSCDETSTAIVTSDKEIMAHLIWSQIEEHREYGGVVPEIAARAHVELLENMVLDALKEAKLTLAQIDAIAVTAGPGLIGGVIVGLMMAKAMASASNTPLIAVNHLEGHALSARLSHDIAFPYLLLLVSGGHCQILLVAGVGCYTKLGTTIDDALGEVFDKVARMLKLGYPGGALVEQAAKEGNANRFNFPRAMKGRVGCDFSFSGLKTAVKRQVNLLELDAPLSVQDKADVAASFQAAIGDILIDRVKNALTICAELSPTARDFVIAGGVAANQYIRSRLLPLAERHGFTLTVPPSKLCTDNAAMIAWVGVEKYQLGQFSEMSVLPKARWPLF